MRSKFIGEVCVMTLKNDIKLEEELTCQFQIDKRNLTNFDTNFENHKNLHFNRLLLMKVCNA